jgi:2-phosphoglycerate kinase
VLLIGGPSGVGKSTVAVQVAKRLGAAWLQVDDLRLALARCGVPVPNADAVATFDAPGGLITLGDSMAPAIEVVIENHVDQRNPLVIEGEGILPSLFDRPSVRARATNGHARAVFLYEADEDAHDANMQSRKVGLSRRAHARKNFRYGEWLKEEAGPRGLPAVRARPWDTLADCILATSGLSPDACPFPRDRTTWTG